MDKFIAAGVRWWVPGSRPDLLRDFPAHLSSGRIVKDYRHKRTVECDSRGVWIVKIYKPGGAFRRLKAKLLGSRARHELRMYLGVVKRGLPTVPVAAVGERGAESYVVCAKLEGWRSLEQVLLDPATAPSLRRKLLELYGRFARRLHDEGVWQYDFNASNILVDPGRPEDLRVIDFEKMKLGRVGEASRIRTLAKMNRIPRLTRADRLRFFRAYYSDREDVRGLVARTAAQIERQRKRDDARMARLCTRPSRNFAPLPAGAGWYRRRRPDLPGRGLSPEEAAAIAAGDRRGFRAEESGDALAAWREANVRARSGGPVPLAVVVERRGRGVVVFER